MTPIAVWTVKLIGDNWQTVVSTLSGTFLGAYLAFLFQRRHTEKKEIETNISAAKRAQFAIVIQLNALKNMKKQLLDPKREDPYRYLTLPPFSVHAQYPRLDVTSLAFMLQDEGAQLLNEMMISEHLFSSVVGAIEQRNSRHELMQQQLAASGQTAVLNEATITILKDMTDSIYSLSEDALSSLQTSFEKLRAPIEKKFQGIKGLAVEFKY